MTTPSDEPLRSAPPVTVPMSLRAWDADRGQVAELLRSAAVDGRVDMTELDERLGAVFAAKTYGDLAVTVRDLPGGGSAVPAAAAVAAVAHAPVAGSPHRLPATVPSGTVVPRVVDGPRTGASVSVFSDTGRSGHWVVPERYAAVAVFGSVRLDLCAADFAAPEVVITAVAVFGRIEVRVPDGVTVRADGIGVFGAFDSAAGAQAPPGSPVVVIRGASVFGSVEVKRPRRPRGALGRTGRGALDGTAPDDPGGAGYAADQDGDGRAPSR